MEQVLTIPEEITMVLSSSTANGASNKSAKGDYFEVQIEDGLKIPKTARNTNLRVEQADIWWTVPNIETGVNDKLYIFGPDTLDVDQLHTITIPQGLYDVSGLKQTILRELEVAGAKVSPSPLLSIEADEPTNKIEITLNYPTVYIDFTQGDTPRDILGFTNAIFGPFALITPQLAPNVAQFNTINYFIIHSDLTNRGIRFNNRYQQAIAKVGIDVPPGSQILYQPNHPTRVNAQELSGTTRSTIRMWLTDDLNRSVNTNSEDWSVRLVISYLDVVKERI